MKSVVHVLGSGKAVFEPGMIESIRSIDDADTLITAIVEQETLLSDLRFARDRPRGSKEWGEACVAFEEETQRLAHLRYQLSRVAGPSS